MSAIVGSIFDRSTEVGAKKSSADTEDPSLDFCHRAVGLGDGRIEVEFQARCHF